jgi:hypothetical protein
MWVLTAEPALAGFKIRFSRVGFMASFFVAFNRIFINTLKAYLVLYRYIQLLILMHIGENVSPSAFFFRFTEHSPNGAESRTFGTTFRSYGPPCGPYRSLYTLHLAVTSFGATLNMGGWLGLTRQGLSPCKKYQASLAY